MTNKKLSSEKLEKSRQRISSRRRKKWASISYLQPLFDSGIADSSPVKYHRCLSCSSVIQQEDGRLKSTYCNKRFCAVCNHRRTAVLVDKFAPIVRSSIEKGYGFKHITLTFASKDGNNLQKEYKKLWEVWNKTRRSVRNALRSGKLQHITAEERLTAAVKCEINYNNTEYNGKYHPHLHIIVRGNGRLAKFIKKKWVKFAKKIGKEASYNAQNTTEVYSEDALLEVFKYIHKPVNENGNPYPPEVIDNIFRTVKGKRLLRTYGDFRNQNSNKNTEEELEEELEEYDPNVYAWKRPKETDVWEYDTDEGQWFSIRTGETLLDDQPAHTRARALTSKDNPDKSPATDPLHGAAISAFQGHMRTLEPDKEDPIFREQIKKSWKEWKQRNG